jgi:hypothetical protein
MRVFVLAPALLAAALVLGSAHVSFAQREGYGQIELEVSTTDEQPVEARAYAFGPEGRVQTFRFRGDVAARQSSRYLLPGTYEVEVWAEGYRPQRIAGIEVKGGMATPVKVRLRRGLEVEEVGMSNVTREELENGSLEGCVRDEKGAVLKFTLAGTAREEPRAGNSRYVRLYATNSSAYSTYTSAAGENDGKSGFSVQMDRYMGGYYKLRYVLPGIYDLTVTGEDFHGVQTLRGVEIRPGVRTLLDITLARGPAVDIEKPVVKRKALVPSS